MSRWVGRRVRWLVSVGLLLCTSCCAGPEEELVVSPGATGGEAGREVPPAEASSGSQESPTGSGSTGRAAGFGNQGGGGGGGPGESGAGGETIRPEVSVPVRVRNVSARSGDAVPITLSVGLAQGRFEAGRIAPLLNGRLLPAQVEVPATHRDGSPRHALVSLLLPRVDGGEQLGLVIGNVAPLAPGRFENAVGPEALDVRAEFQEQNGRFSVFELHDGAALIQAAVQGRAPEGYRLIRGGPVVFEVEKVARPVSRDGQAHPFLEVRCRFRLCQGWRGARIEVVVENANAPQRSMDDGYRYDDLAFRSVRIRGGPELRRTLFERRDLLHWDQTRYRAVGWIGNPPPEFVIRQSVESLVQAGFVPKYDYRHPISDAVARREALSMVARSTRYHPDRSETGVPLVPDPVTPYMPQTGGRRDIGPYPDWAVLALQSTERTAQRLLLAADGNGLASFPIHLRHPESGAPGLPYDHPGQKQQRFFRAPKNRCPQTPDKMHTPSAAFLSYLLTGEEFYAEELSFWAAFGIAGYPFNGMPTGPGRRDGAWQLRNLTDAAFLLPDRHPLKEYFNQRVEATLATWRGMSVATSKKLHVIQDGSWRISGRRDYVCALRISPWMYTWFVWSLDNSARKGFAAAGPIRDWCARFVIGLYTDKTPFRAPDGKTYVMDPEAAMAYSLPVALVRPKVTPGGPWNEYEFVRPIESYGELYYYMLVNESNSFNGSEGFKGRLPPDVGPEGWRIQQDRAAGIGAKHPSWEVYAQAACAPTLVRLGLPGARAVYDFLQRKRAMKPPAGGYVKGLMIVP